MYPAENLKAENILDWKDNIWHIEHEGFPHATLLMLNIILGLTDM